MDLKEYIIKISAAVLFISAGAVYAFSMEKPVQKFDIGKDNSALSVVTTEEISGNITDDIPEITYSSPDITPVAENAIDINRFQQETVQEQEIVREPDENLPDLKNDRLININTDNPEELKKLPGIGQSKASAILEYRKDHGDFKSCEEIMKVPGIKEGTYKKIKDLITCR